MAKMPKMISSPRKTRHTYTLHHGELVAAAAAAMLTNFTTNKKSLIESQKIS